MKKIVGLFFCFMSIHGGHIVRFRHLPPHELSVQKMAAAIHVFKTYYDMVKPVGNGDELYPFRSLSPQEQDALKPFAEHVKKQGLEVRQIPFKQLTNLTVDSRYESLGYSAEKLLLAEMFIRFVVGEKSPSAVCSYESLLAIQDRRVKDFQRSYTILGASPLEAGDLSWSDKVDKRAVLALCRTMLPSFEKTQSFMIGNCRIKVDDPRVFYGALPRSCDQYRALRAIEKEAQEKCTERDLLSLHARASDV